MTPSRSPLARQLVVPMLAVAIAGIGSGVAATGATAYFRPESADPTDSIVQQESVSGEPIPLAPLTELTSFDARVTIDVDGIVDGQPTQGGLTVELATNDQSMSQIDITGDLLGDVVAKVGGKAVNLFRPKKVSVYTVPEGTYAVVTGLFDVCAKVEDAQVNEVLSQLSPQYLLSILTSSDVARGTFVGDETLDGAPVGHYVIDGETFVTAAQGSGDARVSAFAQSLTSASDADLYVSMEGGYPVAYRGGFSGGFEPLAFDGDLSLDFDLTGVNGNSPVTLPGACDRPISL